jgi:hypothetical protein
MTANKASQKKTVCGPEIQFISINVQFCKIVKQALKKLSGTVYFVLSWWPYITH